MRASSGLRHDTDPQRRASRDGLIREEGQKIADKAGEELLGPSRSRFEKG